MSREYKFRGYCDRDSEWRYGYYISDGITHEIWTMMENGELYASTIDPESLGEFTGLSDKNNKEIYEGDILERRDSNMFSPNDSYKYKVVYSVTKGSYHLEPSTFDHLGDGCRDIYGKSVVEVVGNVYENGNLVK